MDSRNTLTIIAVEVLEVVKDYQKHIVKYYADIMSQIKLLSNHVS